MIIEMIGLYGMSDKEKGYYRKQGTYAYDFVGKKSMASVLTKEEADKIIANKDYYLNQYKAKDIKIIKL